MSEKIGEYEVVRTLYQSTHSECYVCTKEEQLLSYLLKVQNDRKEIAEHEHMISQTIENYSSDSIIIPMIDSVEHQGKFYAVMQYRKNGIFLSEVLQELEKSGRRITIREFCALFMQLTEKLEKLHECLKKITKEESKADDQFIGILHGDIHPGNIFLESCNTIGTEIYWGNLKFTDFENSRIIREDGSVIKTNFEMGYTNGYFAPETRLLTKNKLGGYSDYYSVAAIMARILTGQSICRRFFTYEDVLETFTGEGSLLHYDPLTYEYLLKLIALGLEKEPTYRIRSEGIKRMLLKLQLLSNAVSEQDYYRALECGYCVNINKKAFSQLKFHPDGFGRAVQNLCQGMLRDRTMAHMHLWIYSFLYDMGTQHMNEVRKKDWAYLLLAGIAIFNHHGRSRDAIACYEKLYPLREYIDGFEWYSANNRVCVSYADMFRHDKALEIVRDNMLKLERLKKVHLENIDVVEDKTFYLFMDLARTYSAYGSYLAYEENPECMKYFNKALKEFGENPGNRAITVSHILHYAIQCGDKNLYAEYYGMLKKVRFDNEKELETYFKDNNEVENYLSTSCEKRNTFELWLYLKTIYSFGWYKDFLQLEDSIKRLLKDEFFLSEKDFPMPLVLKLCGELLWNINQEVMTKEAQCFFKMALSMIEREHPRGKKEMNIMKVIFYSIESSMLLKEGFYEKNRHLYKELQEHLKREEMFQLVEELEKLNGINTDQPRIVLKYEYI